LDFKGALRIEFELPVNSSQGLTGGAQLETLTLGEEEFQDVTAQFLYKSDSFKINKIEAKGLGGSLSGSAALTPAHVAIQMSATHIESRNLFRLFHSSLEIRGLCEWDGELTSGYGNDFLSKANGKASFKMENGHLPEVPVLLKTFSAANVLSLVNYLKGQKKEPGIPISRAEGKITIENGIAKSDDPFVIKNDLLQIGFQGQVDLAKQTVKGTVVIHVLTLPDEILGAVPGLKWILMGKNRSFFPIFVGIKGPLQDPKVNTQSLKSLTGPVWQTLNRIFNLPKDIVDKLR
jgi:uncharacterized protein YhdP